ncbi:Zinc finger BED domain containing protein 4 [Dissostichus eleginoides]|uniref:Zinc finger BED domain containing protein 4 n=1 Tax=Dissostichus eleginoides TaxID=100907 RepID=A0AAD9BRJ9_DISEL|nr:Zinc finger BED domain containing protein 4 [Dissostichus eleginoides]
MCKVLAQKYSPPNIQLLLTKATVLDPRYRGSMEDAEVLDDVMQQLLKELLDMKEQHRSREGTSIEESCSKAAGGNDEPPAAKG